jgi:hypothetical protein
MWRILHSCGLRNRHHCGVLRWDIKPARVLFPHTCEGGHPCRAASRVGDQVVSSISGVQQSTAQWSVVCQGWCIRGDGRLEGTRTGASHSFIVYKLTDLLLCKAGWSDFSFTLRRVPWNRHGCVHAADAGVQVGTHSPSSGSLRAVMVEDTVEE